MFKLVVLSALLAVVAARPGYLEHAPQHVVYSAPTIIHEPAYAKIGAVVKHIPTAVSHQSSSIVHSSAHVVEPILAPVIKTSYAAPVLHAEPIYKSYHHAAPALHTSYALPSYSSGWDHAAAW